MLFDGADDGLEVADSADWAFGSNDFTIDMWVRFTNVGQHNAFLGQQQNDTEQNRWNFYWVHTSEKLIFESHAGSSYEISITAPWSPVINQWYHLAVVRKGLTSADWLIFVDGVALTITLSSGSYSATLSDHNAILYIGRYGVSVGDLFMNGWIDELRISKGVARWTANFTPPNIAYA